MTDAPQMSVPTAGLGERLVSGLAAAAAAFEQVAVAPSPQAAAAVPEVVRRLISEVVPRLQAELEVLVPAFELRIPTVMAHRFRFKWPTCSDRNGPPLLKEAERAAA